MTVEAELPTISKVARARPALGLPILFSTTAFMGAALLFLVEPLVAKLLLPSYGGAATVATSTMFFQVVLLGAYLLVHTTSRLGRRRQPAAQLPLVLLALVVLPLALPADAAPDGGWPIVWLLRTLALMVGLPFRSWQPPVRCCSAGMRGRTRPAPRTPTSSTRRATSAASSGCSPIRSSSSPG